MNLYFGISHGSIAEQVAELINAHNQLALRRCKADILSGKIDYVVENHGKDVIAACGLEKQSYTLTEMKHLVVSPAWRGKGVGKFIIKRALTICDTPIVYATVREDNVSSLNLLSSMGFQRAGEYPAEGHRVIMLARTTPKWQQSPDWKLKSYTVPSMGIPMPGSTLRS